jgi:serine phosphatase RsbU (regulator of sigma subunit)
VVTRTVHDIVKVIPGPLKMLLAGMAGLLLAALAGWTTVTLRARRLTRQRRELLAEVGLLQAALLPEVPERVGAVAASVAYRPADGPGAGGDFYDFFEMEDGRIGIVLGDVAGHGRDALARTALLRYTLRAYLETGLEPRTALRLGGETLEHNLASFATAVVAIYDPATSTLTYSSAGHPPPIMLGPGGGKPITVCSSPPIGVGERTGDRQTTVVMPAGTIACFFTDGLAEARVSGDLLGRGRLVEILRELGPEPTAPELLERIRRDVHHTPDDMAACILRPVITDTDATPCRTEELELREGGEEELRRFLEACGVAGAEIDSLMRDSTARRADYGGAIVHVKLAEGVHPQVSIVLPPIELLAAARR